jgi:hypothetical protein
MLVEIKKQKTELLDIKTPLFVKDKHIKRYRRLTEEGILTINFENITSITFWPKDLNCTYFLHDLNEILELQQISQFEFIHKLEKTLEKVSEKF